MLVLFSFVITVTHAISCDESACFSEVARASALRANVMNSVLLALLIPRGMNQPGCCAQHGESYSDKPSRSHDSRALHPGSHWTVLNKHATYEDRFTTNVVFDGLQDESSSVAWRNETS